MKKIVTISTLTAGIGAATIGINANHADAAEYNHHQAPQQQGQFNQQGPRGFNGQFNQQNHHNYNQMNGQWHPQYNHQSSGYKQPQFKQQSFNHNNNTTNSTSSNNSSSSSSSSASSSSSSSSSSSTTTSTSKQTTSSTSGNLYTAGQCTWYVYDRTGGKIPSTWGNTNNWASAAQSSGYTVNNSPEKGSILQTSEGTYGHVAYVESVGSDGSVTVSEMNYSGGPYVTDTRTISASQAKSYNYIHL